MDKQFQRFPVRRDSRPFIGEEARVASDEKEPIRLASAFQSERRVGEVLRKRPCGGFFFCWSPSGPSGPSSVPLEGPITALPSGIKVHAPRPLFFPSQGNNGKISRSTTHATHTARFPAAAPPVLRSISPAAGPKEGGTTLTITGSGFHRSRNLKVRDTTRHFESFSSRLVSFRPLLKKKKKKN